jgi:hypothetical protein
MKFVTRISDRMPYLLQDSPLDPALWLFVLPFVGTAAAVIGIANLF